MAAMYDPWGIADGYHDVDGTWHPTPETTRDRLRVAIRDESDGQHPQPHLWFVEHGSHHSLLGRCDLVLEDGTTEHGIVALPPDLPLGYHHLVPADGGPTTTLIVHPTTCPLPARTWGIAVQVPSLWRSDGWGIGDLRDVGRLAALVRGHGGGAVLISPLHAPAPTWPQENSPYYPSSRRWYNPLLIPIDEPRPMSLDNDPDALIDRDAVWQAKRQALLRRFTRTNGERSPDQAWRRWADAQGDDLWLYCAWSALADELGPAWRAWPDELRHPTSPAVRRRAAEDPTFARRTAFHLWCQWVADGAVHDAARGQPTLIGDLAVGFSPDGADAWQFQDALALDVRIGAPPDELGPDGQDWGLPPFVPRKLRAVGYQPFIQTVRAALRHMSGLRIDHVMGLFRQFWIPAGAPASEGAYVQLPAAELLAIVCLEATRAGAFVVGEDLGTVEDEVREELARRRMLRTKVLLLEPDLPTEWPELCLATVTTHDLPTIAGVWSGADGTPAMREVLEASFESITHPEHDVTASIVAMDGTAEIVDVVAATHAALAASPAVLRLVSADDLALSSHRPNEPGTTGRLHPNWRRRLPVSAEALLARRPATDLTFAFNDVDQQPALSPSRDDGERRSS